MKIESHVRNLKESLDEIADAIKQGIVNKQRTIGFHTSAACADMFEILLHKKNLIPPDILIKHEWFASKNKINEKFRFEFDGKKEIIEMISEIERKRNILCYGKPQREEELEKIIILFNQIKEKFKELGLNEIE
ncbi:hypothetical protein J4434_03920 [Candidatus Woesearchaeota archaeon]|nr:hypothetical protein [Candidatus Woesearchaeota archaeon]